MGEAYDVMRSTLAWALLVVGVGCGKRLDLGGIAPDGSARGDGSIFASWPVTDQRNPRSLRSEGANLYWIADRTAGSAILRCQKHDCANTVTAVVDVEDAELAGFEIRGDLLYVFDSRNIYSCLTSGCRKLQIVVSDAGASAIALDDVNVYWSNRSQLTIYACSLDGCNHRNVVEQSDRTDALELAVHDATLYWIQGEDAFLHPPGSVRMRPKDGSGSWSTLAGVQNQAVSLVIREGFVYWATSFTVGTVARCPLADCSGGPEILASKQSFPHFVEPSGSAIFWINGATWPEDLRPVDVMGCRAADCAATLEVLDRGMGASSGTRNGVFPSRELVADDDAIYWVGDIVNVGSAADGGVAVVGSIRRTERRRSTP